MSRSASFATFDEQPEAITINFGKHRGKPLADIETSYLEWVLTADRITPDLQAAIKTELGTRAPAVPDRWRVPSPTSEDIVSLAELIVAAGESELFESFGSNNNFRAAVTLLKNHLATVVTDPGNLPF